jgi:hypothetical protein
MTFGIISVFLGKDDINTYNYRRVSWIRDANFYNVGRVADKTIIGGGSKESVAKS